MWVIKYGGNAMVDDGERARVLADVRALRSAGGRPVIVHGGGPYIAAALAAAGEESHFVRGLRVTSRSAIEHVERVLTLLGKQLAAEIGDAVALTGRDANLLQAERISEELGEVGRMVSVRRALIDALVAHGYTPVIGCLALSAAGEPLNVNADEVAGAVAAAIGAPLVLLTNVAGVLDDPRDPNSRLPTLSAAEAHARIADGRIAGGMIPKVEAALSVLAQGAPACVIADGRVGGELDRVRLGSAGTRLLP
jgi:acetylglutamate kinase